MQHGIQWLCLLFITVPILGRHLRVSVQQQPVVAHQYNSTSAQFATNQYNSTTTQFATPDDVNEAIFRARERRDNLDFDCRWSKGKLNDLVTAAHARHAATDAMMGDLRTRQAAAQSQYTETIATIDKVKLKRSEQTKLCARFKQYGKDAMEGNDASGDLADTLSDVVKCQEPVLAQGVRLNCYNSTDGKPTITFENAALQAKTTELSNESYNRVQAALFELFHSRSSTAIHQVPAKPPATPPDKEIDVRKCTVPDRAVDCAALSDSMSRLKGILGDQGHRNAEEMRKISKKCVLKKQKIDRNLVRLNNVAKTSSQTLVNLGKEIAAASRQQHIASKGHHDAVHEQSERKQRCKNDIYDLDKQICELKKSRADLLRLRGQSAMVIDCEVSPWKPKAACSKSCDGGKQTFTREVVTKATGGSRCPILTFDTVCNTAACPVDCKVGEWTPWTPCSATCGEGTRSKKRKVLVEPKNGGVPCEPTVESQICTGPPCETDCVLTEWGPWNPCTRACGGGKESRTRGIKKKATGRFHCPKAGSKARTEFEACNTQSCPAKADLKCSSKADLIMLLDGSGSITEKAFEAQKAFAIDLASRFMLDSSKGHLIGAVIFGEGASAVFPLTDDVAVIRSSIAGLQRGRGGASLSGGLIEAKQLLGQGRKDTSNIVFVLSDSPADSEVLSTEAARDLQSYGVRVVVTAVGEGMDASSLKALASKPKKQNFFTAKSFEELQRDVQSRMIEICSAVN